MCKVTLKKEWRWGCQLFPKGTTFEFMGPLEGRRLVYLCKVPGKAGGWVVFPESVHRRPSQFDLLMKEERERKYAEELSRFSQGLRLIQ